jgi:hypothetical protein
VKAADAPVQVLKESFKSKAVGTVMATYDEVLTLLRDANNRKQWD